MDSSAEGGSFWQKFSRIFHGKTADHVEQAIIEASQDGELHAAEGSMLLSVLKLDDLQVQDIMTPRTDLKGVDAKSTIRQAISKIVDSGHSRLPVYMENRDDIVGLIYAKDLLRETLEADGLDKPVSSIMRDPFFVPLTKNALELLNELRSRKMHMAVLLDEYGGTSGVVTIEDIFEEIVGEIEDEHDAPKEAVIEAQSDGSVILAGRAYLDEVDEALNVSLDTDDVDTIGGLLSHIAGRLPVQGEEFELEGYRFCVAEADSKQVRKVVAIPAGHQATPKNAEATAPESAEAEKTEN